MSTAVTKTTYGTHPTLKYLMLRDCKGTSNLLFDLIIREVKIKLGQVSKGCQFQCFPCRRETLLAILEIVVFDEFLLGAVKFLDQTAYVFNVVELIVDKTFVGIPEWAVLFRKDLNHTGPQGNLYGLDAGESQHPESRVEFIEGNRRFEIATWFITVSLLVLIQRAKVGSYTEIGNFIEEILGFTHVRNGEPSLLQHRDEGRKEGNKRKYTQLRFACTKLCIFSVKD